ncbi:MAG: XRE family transcriptional regulator [Sphaerochaetaceae bacterium]|jgi:transcriptional regulator with XRE-family HTH domain|nr:XRE family transcriptional regulator [Sphaerochaetaceae bacterium]
MSENPPMIGKNIQKARMACNLTQNVLSERSGVSKAMLSQIESDKVNPTVATVWKIAKGLGVRIQELLNPEAGIHRVFDVNPNTTETAARLETVENGVLIQVLSPLNMVEDLEIYLLHFPAGASLPSDPHYPGTQEFLTVIKGSVKVQAGENNAVLKAGDFLIYHCDIDHVITNNSSMPAVVHMVVRYTGRR